MAKQQPLISLDPGAYKQPCSRCDESPIYRLTVGAFVIYFCEDCLIHGVLDLFPPKEPVT